MSPPNPTPGPPVAPAPPVAPVGRPWRPLQWGLFLAALFAPPVLTLLAAMADHRGGAAPAMMFLGGAAGGLTAGVMLGCRVGRTTPTKALLGVLFAGIGVVAVITLSGLGCALGDYRLDFK